MPITTFLQLLSTSAIVIAGIVAVVQLQLLRKQRSREAAVQLIHSLQTPAFLEALDIAFGLPAGLSKAQLEERLGDKMKSVLLLFGTFESLGILVHRRQVKIDLVEDFFSGVIIFCWEKFGRYIEEMRVISGRETYYEWTQWLAEQLKKRESKTPAIPAHIAHKDWEA